MMKNENIGKAIRILRAVNGITQAKLADDVGCNFSYISYIEKGDRNPSEEMMEKIFEALHVTREQFEPFTLSGSDLLFHTVSSGIGRTVSSIMYGAGIS